MDQQTIIVTGNGGVGNAVANKFLEQGWKVLQISKKNKNQFEEQAKAGTYIFVECDLSDPEASAKTADKLLELGNSLSALVHTAIGKVVSKKFLNLPPEDFFSSFQVELFGGFVLMQAAAKLMVKHGGGSIIAISSSYSEPGVSHPSLTAYLSSKQALRGLLREMALELAPVNIRVNAVAPSFMPIGLNKDVPERLVEFMKEKNPMGQLVSASQVANIVYYLCGPEAKAITGVHLPVSYGEAMTL